MAAGKRLREVMLWAEGRAVLIDQGLILGDLVLLCHKASCYITR